MAARVSGSDWTSTRWWLPLTRFLSILVSQMSAKKLQRFAPFRFIDVLSLAHNTD